MAPAEIDPKTTVSIQDVRDIEREATRANEQILEIVILKNLWKLMVLKEGKLFYLI